MKMNSLHSVFLLFKLIFNIKYWFIIFMFFFFGFSYAAKGDSLQRKLDEIIKQKEKYAKKKNKIISFYKEKLSHTNLENQYKINEQLYLEYKKYKIDSAVFYVNKNIEISNALKNKDLNLKSYIQLSNLYSSSGKYLESQKILQSIKAKTLPKNLLAIYYEYYSQFYEHYATNNPNPVYIEHIEIYRDSLLAVLNPKTIKYRINLAQKNIYKRNLADAKRDLLKLFVGSKFKDANYAMYTYLLGDIYKLENNSQEKNKYYTLAAISDIENVIKDNAAIQNLSIINYESGDIDHAYLYAKSAVEDAVFCNVKFRTLNISEIYSIINTVYLEKEEKSKKQLITYLLMISVLVVFLGIAIFYLYYQMKKIQKIRRELAVNAKELKILNEKIQLTNLSLKENNIKLTESNTIKEEYITQFFDICSAYIRKMEDYRISLLKKMQNKQYGELDKTLKSNTFITTELGELYHTFDIVFINLYPNFVSEFNNLLQAQEQIEPRNGEILNTELRIFALIRLGITDSVKIAAFLRYSLSTIYNYRTKVRNKSAVNREDFELMVSKIGMKKTD